MTNAWVALVLATAAGVSAAGCDKKFDCAARGDTSALTAWQERGFVVDAPNAQVCEASAERFVAIYTSPMWVDAWSNLGTALKQHGLVDSPRKGYAVELDQSRASSVLEKCGAVDHQGKLLDCTDEIRLRVVPAGPGFAGHPFTVRADYSNAPHYYSFGERRDGPVPAFARARAR